MSERPDIKKIIREDLLRKGQFFQYFEERDDKKPLHNINFGKIIIGQKSYVYVYAKNITGDFLEKIEFTPDHSDLKIEWGENQIEPEGMILVKFSVTPKNKLPQGVEYGFSVSGQARKVEDPKNVYYDSEGQLRRGIRGKPIDLRHTVKGRSIGNEQSTFSIRGKRILKEFDFGFSVTGREITPNDLQFTVKGRQVKARNG